jgi:hypothetical protein
MLTAHDCVELGIADQVVGEPEGGAHVDPREASSSLKSAILANIVQLAKMSQGKLLKKRYRKFRRMGEESGHSQEAMSREVELLMSITSDDASPGRPSRKQRRKSREGEPAEAPVASDD